MCFFKKRKTKANRDQRRRNEIKMNDNNNVKIENAVQEFILSHEQIQEVMDRLIAEMQRGLKKATNPEATVKMFPTYVRQLPNGKETGKFLALDLGGTNFRVLLIELNAGDVHMESKIFAIPTPIMTGTGEQLFDHIADCLAHFMDELNINEKLPLGFTFSFPCRQEGLTKARLVSWTKGFNCSGVVNEDVVDLLRKAIQKRKDVEIDVVALVNDTTGTLMSCAYKNPHCMIGAIVGTGTNACYMERLDNVELWDGPKDEPNQVIINCEWGAFGDSGSLDFVRTNYDRTIDEKSVNRGRQIYEKMISGMYMGELVRLALLRLANEGVLFKGKVSETLRKSDSFYTKYVSEIEEDSGLNTAKEVLEELGLNFATEEDCKCVKYICSLVSKRAAYLTAAGLAALLNKINKPFVTIGIDGSVYRFHPYFGKLLNEKIKELIPSNLDFEVMLSEDGSGKGAALVAAVAVRENQ